MAHSVDAEKLSEYLCEITDETVSLKQEMQEWLDKWPYSGWFPLKRSDMDKIVFCLAALQIFTEGAMTSVLNIVTDGTDKTDAEIEAYLDSFQSFFAEVETYKRSS